MTTQARLSMPVEAPPPPATLDTTRLYQEGIVAGILGAVTIAVWFLLLDTLAGRPLWTPTVLGTVIFRGGVGPGTLETLPVSLEMVLMFTWVHGLVFVGLGGIAARLLGYVERHPSSGFGVLLLFVVFQFGFIVVATIVAAPVLRVLSSWSILVANLLAAAAMTAYFRRRHPGLEVRP
jgi:hypothetical protein